MARNNNNWLVVALLIALTLFGLVCISQREPSAATPQDKFSRLGGPNPHNPHLDLADNVEILDAGPDYETAETLPPYADPQQGTGPGLWGRQRHTSEV